MRRIVKRRIEGTEGTERIRILRGLLNEFPGYTNGPYGELRKWVQGLIDESAVRRSVKHQEEFHVPKEGCAQVVLVGAPNSGKSTLLRELTHRPVAVGNYRVTGPSAQFAGQTLGLSHALHDGDEVDLALHA